MIFRQISFFTRLEIYYEYFRRYQDSYERKELEKA